MFCLNFCQLQLTLFTIVLHIKQACICNVLPHVTSAFFKKDQHMIFHKFNDSARQLVAHDPKPCYTDTQCTVKRVVNACGNALHYGLSMFLKFKNMPCPSAISISVRFHTHFHLLIWNLLNK